MASNSSPLRFAADFPQQAILRDFTDVSGLRVLVMRGPFSFCAYVGVKADHALAGLEELDFHCHHGITFQRWGSDTSPWPEGWYWWGWDYAHYTDKVDGGQAGLVDASLELSQALKGLNAMFKKPHPRPVKNWTVDEVSEDALDVLMELKESLLRSEECAKLVFAGGGERPA